MLNRACHSVRSAFRTQLLFAVVIGLFFLVGCRASPAPSASTASPNVVFLLVDDLDETSSPYWDALPQTRALIADRGLTFTNAFVTDPICCPARATILSGKYPHNTGVYDNSPPDGGAAAFVGAPEKESVGVRLKAAGYTTAFLGKYLNGYEENPQHVPPGWYEWFGLAGTFNDGYTYKVNHNGSLESYGKDPDDYQTDVLSEQAVRFLDRAEADDARPFFLFLSTSAPHGNFPPAPRHTDHVFADDPLPTRPNLNEEDVSDKPSWLRDGVAPLDQSKLDRLTALHAKMMGSLLAVDDMVASVASALEEHGELDRTVLVFTSDNGYNLGAHRLRHKMVPYDESLRVPLAISGPGVPTGVEDRFVTNADFVPTLLDLAGAEVTDDLDGRSLVPLFEGTADRWRTDFLVEFRGTYDPFYRLDTRRDVDRILASGGSVTLVPTYRALRTDRRLYVEWYGGDDHEYEFYDVSEDPYQLENLLATPGAANSHRAEVAELHARLEELSECSGVSCRR
jgi:N-acetylglucosamine-6-sulfatase